MNPMKRINLKLLIAQYDLDKKEIAAHLFPKNKHPVLSFNRAMKQISPLDEMQISKLASYVGVTIPELYSNKWERISSKNIHVFSRGGFRAELNTATWVTKLFHKTSLFHDAVIHDGSTSIEDYFNQLDNLTLNFKSND